MFVGSEQDFLRGSGALRGQGPVFSPLPHSALVAVLGTDARQENANLSREP